MNDLKQLPQAIEIEKAVLGAMMIEPPAIDRVRGILKGIHFRNRTNQIIYNIITELHDQGIIPDQVTITEYLASKNLLEEISPAYVAQLASDVATAANAEYHAQIVFDKAQRRLLIAQATVALEDAYDENSDIRHHLEKNQKRLMWIQNREHDGDLDHATKLALLETDLDDPEAIEEIIHQIQKNEFQKLPGYFLEKLREHAQELVISSNGKTLATLDQIRKILDDQETHNAIHSPIHFKDWIKMSTHTPSLVNKMIYEGEIHAFIGKPESGKSFFTTFLTLSLSCGIPIWDMATQQSKVLIVNQDTPETRQRARFRAITAGHKILTPDLDRAVLHHYPTFLDLSDATSRQLLTQFVRINEIDVLVIDTITDVLGFYEELNPQHINAIKRLFQELGITVIFIQHGNKTKGMKGTDLIRGAWAGVIDSAYEFTKTDAKSNLFSIKQIKQRNAPFQDIHYELRVAENFSSVQFIADHFVEESEGEDEG